MSTLVELNPGIRAGGGCGRRQRGEGSGKEQTGSARSNPFGARNRTHDSVPVWAARLSSQASEIMTQVSVHPLYRVSLALAGSGLMVTGVIDQSMVG
jgi:hypothetical protein